MRARGVTSGRHGGHHPRARSPLCGGPLSQCTDDLFDHGGRQRLPGLPTSRRRPRRLGRPAPGKELFGGYDRDWLGTRSYLEETTRAKYEGRGACSMQPVGLVRRLPTRLVMARFRPTRDRGSGRRYARHGASIPTGLAGPRQFCVWQRVAGAVSIKSIGQGRVASLVPCDGDLSGGNVAHRDMPPSR